MNRCLFASIVGVLAFGALLIGPQAWAQADKTVDIGGVTLELGASRADTMAAIRPRLRLLPSRTPGYYNLYRNTSGSNDGPIHSLAIGAITIRDGRLVSVTRNLGSFQSLDGRLAIDNLIAAIGEAKAELGENADSGYYNKRGAPRPPQVTVHTDTQQVANDTSTRVYLVFPDRTIQLAVYQPSESGARATVDISEQYILRQND